MRSNFTILLGAASAAALALTLAGAAQAENAANPAAAPAPAAQPSAGTPPDATAATTNDQGLQEIVITADRKGTEVVQVGSFRGATQLDTPLAISVVPRDLIDTQQASQMADILKNTPGVTMSQTSPTVYSNVAIRGIVTENRTNYRMDGFLPVVNLIDMAIEDKERVEALKGASAIYYGFSPPSGIINMVMKRPTRDWMLNAHLFGNDHGRWGVHIDTGDTIGIFGYRINAVYDRPDSGIDNTRGRRTVLAGAFDVRPTDTLTLQIDAEHLFKKVNEPGIWRLAPPATPTTAAQVTALVKSGRIGLVPTQNNPRGTIPLPPLLDPSTNFGPDWAANRAEESNGMAKLAWKFAHNWELSAAAGFSNLRRDRHFNNLDWTQVNTDPTKGPVGEFIMTQLQTQQGSRVKNQNYRAELAGAFDTGPLHHELLIGAARLLRFNIASSPASLSYSCLYSAAAGSVGKLVGIILQPTQAAPAGTVAAPCTQNPFNPHPIPTPTTEMVPNGAVKAKFLDTGVYVFDRIKIADWLQVLGGIRYTNYLQYTDVNTGAGRYKAKPVSLSGGAIVKPMRSMSLYATYIDGIEPAPLPGSQATNQNDVFPPAKSTQYEVGFKWEIHRGLLFQSAAFRINRPFYLLNAQNIFGPDGRSRYQGVELSLNGSITRQLSIYASALFLDAKQTSGAPTIVSKLLAPDGSFFITPSTVGNRIENTAKFSSNMTLNYDFAGPLEGLSVNGGVFHTGNQPINPLNSNFIPAVTTFDLGAGYRIHAGTVPLIVRVNWENVGNKKYFISTGSNVVAQAPPSTVKFSLEADF